MYAAEPCRYHYLMHGLRLTVRTDTPAVLAALDARLHHFRTATEGAPDITVEAHTVPDITRHIVAPLDEPARPVYDAASGVVLYADGSQRLYLDDEVSVRAMCDPFTSTITMSIAGTHPGAAWLASHPMLTIPLIDLLKRRGRFSLHAGCLSRAGDGLLLAGTSGAGKSTLTLALLRAGFDFLGDDLVFLRPGPDGIQALAFPDEIDLTDDTIRCFPELEPILATPRAEGWPKRQVRPEVLYGSTIPSDCRPSVLVFPQVSGNPTSTLVPLERGLAFLEVIPNILLTDPESSQSHFDALSALVQQCDCYRLETGTDLDEAVNLLRDLVR
jgi:hypothetical protein